MMLSLGALILGFLLDLVIGDPHFLYHPIRLVGNLIERRKKPCAVCSLGQSAGAGSRDFSGGGCDGHYHISSGAAVIWGWKAGMGISVCS